MAQPDLILTPFGENASPGSINPIPEARGPGDLPQAAAWQSGFPPVTMIPLAAGGIPPRGQDFNGVLNSISEHTVFQGGGGQYKWDAAYVAAKGGYPKDAVLQSDDGSAAYVSLIDNNSVNFNTTPAAIGVSWGEYTGDWSAQTVSQAEAEAGTATTRRAWTAQRVRQAIVAWWNGVSTTWSQGFVSSESAEEARNTLGLGTAATAPLQADVLDTTPGTAVRVGGFGWGSTAGIGISATTVVGELPSGQYYDMSPLNEKLFPISSTNTLVMGAGGAGNKALLSIKRGAGALRGFIGSHNGPDDGTEFAELYHTGNISTASVAHAATAGSATTATTAQNALGVGQTWQNLTASRALTTTYTNTTGRTIAIQIALNTPTGSKAADLFVSGQFFSGANGDDRVSFSAIVPPGDTYRVDANYSIFRWMELR